MISFLRGDAFARIEPYIIYRLDISNLGNCNDEVKKVINIIATLFIYLAQIYSDLDETKSVELKLLKLV